MPPSNAKIYHITHVDNLAQILSTGLWSDAERIRQGIDCHLVGMSEIKRRRLEELPVKCHPGTHVGEFVPFYFCFRSIMLYLLYQGNHPELSYKGGQKPIVHLEMDLHAAVAWAEKHGRRWSFSNGNAGTRYTPFYRSLDELRVLDWSAIAATDWRDSFIKDRKQAEFLIEKSLPWELVERIGVIDDDIRNKVLNVQGLAAHKPSVVVMRDWYY